MKSVIVVACILAAVIPARSLDDTIIPKYMEYLMPDVQPCAEQFKVSEDKMTSIQKAAEIDPKVMGCLKACVMKRIGVDSSLSKAGEVDPKVMGCLKACVMKRIGILTGVDFHMEPIYKMINVVHAGNDQEIKDVTAIADTCAGEIKGETDECVIGSKYTDCYIEKLFA